MRKTTRSGSRKVEEIIAAIHAGAMESYRRTAFPTANRTRLKVPKIQKQLQLLKVWIWGIIQGSSTTKNAYTHDTLGLHCIGMVGNMVQLNRKQCDSRIGCSQMGMQVGYPSIGWK